MQWTIACQEPESRYAPILSEEQLQSGIVKKVVNSLPWYKRTPKMEILLAWELMPILRSGFQKSYLLAQLERLDIAKEVAENFLGMLTDQGACRFGEPQLFYNPIQQAVPYKDGMIVQTEHAKNKLFISSIMSRSLQLLDRFLPRQEYLRALKDLLGDEARAAQVCSSLARQGLLLSCDSPQISMHDPGPLRFSLDIFVDGEMLDAAAWEKRLDFITDSFKPYFFQSNNFFVNPPIRLCGDFHTTIEKASPRYFWDLYFRFQSYAQEVPVDLKLSSPIVQSGWQALRLETPLLFHWNLMADLRGGGGPTVEELNDFVSSPEFSGDVVTLLTDQELPDKLALVGNRVKIKLYYAKRPPDVDISNLPPSLGQTARRSLIPYLCEEGCNAASSLYIDGRGDVYTCSLEGAPCLGNIAQGAKAVEKRRRELRRDLKAACLFGKNPGDVTKQIALNEVSKGLKAAVLENYSPTNFFCP